MIAVNTLNNYCPYEVGDIYVTLRDENPSNRWGGTTWERIKDRFLLAAGDSYAAGGTGGEATVALTNENNGPHSHTFSGTTSTNGAHTHPTQGWKGAAGDGQALHRWQQSVDPVDYNSPILSAGNHSHTYSGTTSSSGTGTPHNNMPPYLAVYMWKRIS